MKKGIPPWLWSRVLGYGGGVAEQVAFSTGTFVALLLLGRQLEVDTFGYVAAIQGLVLLATTVQSSLITEPAIVLVSGAQRLGARPFLIRVFAWHAALVILLALFSGVVMTVLIPGFGSMEFLATAGLAIFLPTNLLLRRLGYALSARPISLTGSVIYTSILLALVSTASEDTGLATAIAYFSIAGACSAIALGGLVWLTLRGAQPSAPTGPVMRDLWRLGKWSLAGGSVFFAGTGLIPIVLASLQGPSAAASWGAAYNLTTPITQLSAGIGLVLLPRMARRFYRLDGRMRVNGAAVSRVSIRVVLGLSLFASPVLLAPRRILDLAYDGLYNDSVGLLLLLALAALVDAYKQCFTTALVAAQRPRRVAYARFIGVVTLAITATGFFVAFSLPISIGLGLVVSNLVIVAVVRRGLSK